MDTEEIVVVIIRNSKGEFFAHQRSKERKTHPNLFGLGIGGHIKEGENHQIAAQRELQEEANLEASIKYLFFLDYQPESGEKYKIFLYETLAEQEIKTYPEEWQWSGWMNKTSLDKLSKENKLCPDTAIFYQEYLKKYLSQ